MSSKRPAKEKPSQTLQLKQLEQFKQKAYDDSECQRTQPITLLKAQPTTTLRRTQSRPLARPHYRLQLLGRSAMWRNEVYGLPILSPDPNPESLPSESNPDR
jgi:hypothetical protein